MATNIKRKVRKLQVQGDMPPACDLEFSILGYTLLDGDDPTDTPENLWARYGKTIMQLQGQKCVEPLPFGLSTSKVYFDYFTRPGLWWMCGPGAEEPRRLVSGDPAKIINDGKFFLGVPNHYVDAKQGCVFETEKDYLIRRDLLTAAEKKIA